MFQYVRDTTLIWFEMQDIACTVSLFTVAIRRTPCIASIETNTELGLCGSLGERGDRTRTILFRVRRANSYATRIHVQ